MSGQSDPFQASAATIGYLFQLRQALLFCVEQHATGFDWSVAVEAGDDIEVHQEESSSLWQLKHRAPGTKITDAATDLWKSLRIWATVTPNWATADDQPGLFLLSTAHASEGSAAYCLRPAATGVRDEAKALLLLEKAREASSNKTLKQAFEAWDKLDQPQRVRLLARVQVLDMALDIDATTALLISRATLAVGREHAHAFLQRLDGWFLQRVTTMLRDHTVGPVTGVEFDDVFTQRQNQFRPHNLPIDGDIVDLETGDDDRSDRIFVRQLGLTRIGERRVERAIRDFVRAFAQRSRWSNENLMRPGEIGEYERRLVEEWQTRFDIMADDLGEEAAEEEKLREAKNIYAWVERDARIPIRPGCDEPFVTKGSYHLLADELRVGWHPDFLARLMTLLEPAGRR